MPAQDSYDSPSVPSSPQYRTTISLRANPLEKNLVPPLWNTTNLRTILVFLNFGCALDSLGIRFKNWAPPQRIINWGWRVGRDLGIAFKKKKVLQVIPRHK